MDALFTISLLYYFVHSPLSIITAQVSLIITVKEPVLKFSLQMYLISTPPPVQGLIKPSQSFQQTNPVLIRALRYTVRRQSTVRFPSVNVKLGVYIFYLLADHCLPVKRARQSPSGSPVVRGAGENRRSLTLVWEGEVWRHWVLETSDSRSSCRPELQQPRDHCIPEHCMKSAQCAFSLPKNPHTPPSELPENHKKTKLM